MTPQGDQCPYPFTRNERFWNYTQYHYHHSAAISACEKAGGNDAMSNALTLLKEMKESKITPNTITYSAAISACEKAGGIDGMTNSLTLLKEMKDSGIYTQYHYLQRRYFRL